MSTPSPRKFFEVTSTPTGTLVLYCGMCDEQTYESQKYCCSWLGEMVNKYLRGGNSVASLALPE